MSERKEGWKELEICMLTYTVGRLWCEIIRRQQRSGRVGKVCVKWLTGAHIYMRHGSIRLWVIPGFTHKHTQAHIWTHTHQHRLTSTHTHTHTWGALFLHGCSFNSAACHCINSHLDFRISRQGHFTQYKVNYSTGCFCCCNSHVPPNKQLVLKYTFYKHYTWGCFRKSFDYIPLPSCRIIWWIVRFFKEFLTVKRSLSSVLFIQYLYKQYNNKL